MFRTNRISSVDAACFHSADLSLSLSAVCTACIEEIYGLGSFAPGAILKEAYVKFTHRKADTEDYIRSIQHQNLLGQAVDTCVKAAGMIFEPEGQVRQASAQGMVISVGHRGLARDRAHVVVPPGGLARPPSPTHSYTSVSQIRAWGCAGNALFPSIRNRAAEG